MNRLTSLYVLIAFCFSVLSAGSPDKLVGTKTSTTVVNGKVMQKSETIAEPNPLPPAQSILDQEKSQSIPNSGLYIPMFVG